MFSCPLGLGIREGRPPETPGESYHLLTRSASPCSPGDQTGSTNPAELSGLKDAKILLILLVLEMLMEGENLRTRETILAATFFCAKITGVGGNCLQGAEIQQKPVSVKGGEFHQASGQGCCAWARYMGHGKMDRDPGAGIRTVRTAARSQGSCREVAGAVSVDPCVL